MNRGKSYMERAVLDAALKGNMNQHTPGPWTCQPIGDETECNILGRGRELVATVSDNDARIIAAAPDLYEAAKVVLDALSKRGQTDPLYLDAASWLCPAIKKAEGN